MKTSRMLTVAALLALANPMVADVPHSPRRSPDRSKRTPEDVAERLGRRAAKMARRAARHKNAAKKIEDAP